MMLAIIKEIAMALLPYGVVRFIISSRGSRAARAFAVMKEILRALVPYGIVRIVNLNPKRVTRNRSAYARMLEAESRGKKEVFENIYALNLWSSSKSRSGPGSEMYATRNIRKALPKIWEEYGIKTFLDVPCGDYYWMKSVDKSGIAYIGADIVEQIAEQNNRLYGAKNVTFMTLDITKDELPKADMIFCKDCLQHLSLDSVRKAMQNFKKSGAKYLLATSYPLTAKNWDIPDGGCRPLNLLIAPFNLPPPLCTIRQGIIGGEIDRGEHLFEIKDMNVGPSIKLEAP